ncbi:hypothetical protein ACIF8W_11670 [Streptomyces sp. NPDC085639]|uniref:hypothetical protein n=1 Tax=Streptomyces sp. NPDC085639 TaxID=3365734 RepID=UPI0037D7DCFA
MSRLKAPASAASGGLARTGPHPASARSWFTSSTTSASSAEWPSSGGRGAGVADVEGVADFEGVGAGVLLEGTGAGGAAGLVRGALGEGAVVAGAGADGEGEVLEGAGVLGEADGELLGEGLADAEGDGEGEAGLLGDAVPGPVLAEARPDRFARPRSAASGSVEALARGAAVGVSVPLTPT